MRIIAQYQKIDAAAWISHLDLQRTIGRALRRANIPVAYSQGFNPHPLLSFATALSVGCPSEAECMDVGLAADIAAADCPPEAFMHAMNNALPQGLLILRACAVQDSAPSPMAIVTAAEYIASVPQSREEIVQFLSQGEILAVKRSKKGARKVDIAPMIYSYEAESAAEGTLLRLTLRQDNALALNPALLLSAMGAQDAQIKRIRLLAGDGELFSRYS